MSISNPTKAVATRVTAPQRATPGATRGPSMGTAKYPPTADAPLATATTTPIRASLLPAASRPMGTYDPSSPRHAPTAMLAHTPTCTPRFRSSCR